MTGEDKSGLRQDWLTKNPHENAVLALWGQTKPYTLAAYEEMYQLAEDLEMHVPSDAMPLDVATPWFDYSAATLEFTANSSEAKLIRIDNPDLDAWGVEHLGWKPIKEQEGLRSSESYLLDTQWAGQDEAYALIDTEENEAQLQYYLDNQDELVKQYNGRVLVIKENKVLGDFDSEIDAITKISKTHKIGTFLVQKCTPGKDEYTHTFHSRVAFS